MSSLDPPRDRIYQVDIGAAFAPALRHWLRIGVVTLVAVGLVYLLLLLIPRTYEATAVLAVQPNAAGGAATAADVDHLAASQTGLVTSTDALTAVIGTLHLRDIPEFSAPDASPVSALLRLIGIEPKPAATGDLVLARLRDRVDVVGSGASAEIAITVRSANADRAAAIANALAGESVKRRADQARSEATSASSWLQQEIARLRQKVTDAETAIAGFRADNDLFTGGNATPITSENLSTISAQIADAQKRGNDAQSRADLIRGLLSSNQPLDGVSDVRNSVVIQGLLGTLATLKAQLAQKSTTLLSNHPTIKALKAQIGELEAQVTTEGRRIAAALDAEAKIEADLEQKLGDDLARAKTAATTTARGEVTLDDLQRQLNADQGQLQNDLALFAANTSTNGSNQDVRILKQAVVPGEAASPKVPLILGLVGVLVLAAQIGSAMLADPRHVPGSADWDEDAPDESAVPATAAGPVGTAEPVVAVKVYPEQSPTDDVYDEEDAEVMYLEDEAALMNAEDDADPWVTDADVLLQQDDWVVPAAPDVTLEESDEQVEEDDTFTVSPGAEVTDDSAEPSQPPATEAQPRSPLDLERLAALVSRDRPRIVLLACVADPADGALVTARLVAGAHAAGLSAVEVDAGSGAVSPDAGLSDLSAAGADFGSVVQRLAEDHAIVPWGRLAAIDRRSPRPTTLVSALSDIYDLVVVNTGRIGMGSTLPLFVGTGATVILVTDSIAGRDTNARAVREIEAFDLSVTHVIAVPNFRYRVA